MVNTVVTIVDKALKDYSSLGIPEEVTLYLLEGDITCNVISSKVEQENLYLSLEVPQDIHDRLSREEDKILDIVDFELIINNELSKDWMFIEARLN